MLSSEERERERDTGPELPCLVGDLGAAGRGLGVLHVLGRGLDDAVAGALDGRGDVLPRHHAGHHLHHGLLGGEVHRRGHDAGQALTAASARWWRRSWRTSSR